MKETFGATSGVGVGGSDESRAVATVSGDIKESVCNGEWNLILPNTQSIEPYSFLCGINNISKFLAGEPVVSQHCDTACLQRNYVEHDGLLVA